MYWMQYHLVWGKKKHTIKVQLPPVENEDAEALEGKVFHKVTQLLEMPGPRYHVSLARICAGHAATQG